MDATALNKKVSQRLLDMGFKGTLPIPQAKVIIDKVKAEFTDPRFDISVEMAPIHQIGKMLCNCERSIIRVQPKNTTARKRL